MIQRVFLPDPGDAYARSQIAFCLTAPVFSFIDALSFQAFLSFGVGCINFQI